MIYAGIFCAIMAIAIFIALMCLGDEKNKAGALIGCTMALFIMCAVAFITESISPAMKPMDVYQGKTTLEYKVVDGVKVDSTVVWKEE